MKRRLTMIFASLFLCIGAALAQTEVNGTVVSQEDGQPVIGASIQVVGTSTGVVTDLDGKFSLAMPSGKTMLRISYVGMETQELKAGRDMKVVLKSDSQMLEDLVVIGYGSAKKLGSVVGAVSTVGSKKIEKNTTSNFTDALSGQVTGLSVLTGSGDPTASATIRLRGVNSINASTAPLFILDGAPITSAVFNSLNPGDIENITVLKDASSTAIYGSRAANGVIVITSKKGKFEQKPTVTIRAQYGFSKMVEDQMDMMNSEQYIQFREMLGAPVSQNIKDLVQNYGISTNWRDEVFDGHAPTYTIDASVHGGSANTSYYLSVNHHEQEGIVDQSGLRREAIRLNLDARINKWLKVGVQSNLGFRKYETNNEMDDLANSRMYKETPTVFARVALPYDSPRNYSFDENGNIQWGDRATHLLYSGGLTTPWFISDNRDVFRRAVTVNMNVYEEITPIKGLIIRAQQALDSYDNTISNKVYPFKAFTTPMGVNVAGSDGASQETFSRYYAFTYTNTAEYKFNIDNHNVSVLAGQESIITKSKGFGVFADGYTDARQLLLTQTPNPVPGSNMSHSIVETVFNSFFFTGSYNYASKYFFDATYRRDGSSKFPKSGRWANFWSVGAMWDIKKENFMSNVRWLDDWNVKVSYGTTGNSAIGDYAYFGLVGSGRPYNGESSIGIAQPSAEDLTWEKVAALNIGTSFRLFNRLSGTFDFYHKKTTDLLMPIPYSFTTGHDSGAGNIGAMVNKGVELELKYDIIQRPDMFWNVRANFNYNKNEITELFNGRDEYKLPDYSLCYRVGHSVGELYAVRRAGVDPRDGKQIWYDKDGNLTKVYNEERDAVLLGKDRFAPYYGGFGTEFGWKDFSINLDFTWAAKKYMSSNERYFLENPSQGLSSNQSTAMLNMWTHPGQITDIPAATEAIHFDDHLIENASFLRLKNITIQYSLPKSILKYTRSIERCNFFFTGRNLLTWTGFTGYDPEPDSNVVQFAYPNTRQYVFGVEVTF